MRSWTRTLLVSVLWAHLGPIDAKKRMSWLGANRIVTHQRDQTHSRNSSALAELNDKIYVFGGSNGIGGEAIRNISTADLIFTPEQSKFVNLAGLYDDFHEYDLSSHTWSDLSNLNQFGTVKPSARKSHGFVSSGGKLFVFGGLTDTSGKVHCTQCNDYYFIVLLYCALFRASISPSS
jgi:hypothetical protein